MYKSNQCLLDRYQWLNRHWVGFPAALQIQMSKEMSEIKAKLLERGIRL
ncbi:hypothetical protein ACPV5O_20850 [Vibrio maritimus]|uniref:Uncharacterized protein n=1 Tax=Vibrio chaetopteri TaxID=3016528 RepID=A0AAU8BTZ7_9VIBR